MEEKKMVGVYVDVWIELKREVSSDINILTWSSGEKTQH